MNPLYGITETGCASGTRRQGGLVRMFFRQRWGNWISSLVLLVGLGACGELGGLGSGCGCGIEPLPEGGLPADQTIEGGAQVRVTRSGLEKITSLIPAAVRDVLGGGFCLPESSVVSSDVIDGTICYEADGSCSPGCRISLEVASAEASPVADREDTLRVAAEFTAATTLSLKWKALWGLLDGECRVAMRFPDIALDGDIRLSVSPETGEVGIDLASINNTDIRVDFEDVQGCGGGLTRAVLNVVADIFEGVINSFLGDFLLNVLRPAINNLLQGFLPTPLGLEGRIDVGAILSGISPGTEAMVEVRGVPGGYARLTGGGLSLGMVTGLNADADPTTRSEEEDNESVRCVPGVAAPDFSAPPASLTRNARGAFELPPADEFLGAPDPASDVAIGVSETVLDLGAHHAYTSGALCLGVGTSLVKQLNLGTIGILVPSLSELGNDEGTDPLLLVTRPQKPADFTVGDGTAESPALTIHLENFEVDFYAFLFERFVRGFTLKLSMNVGVNIEFTTDAMGNPAIMPTLVGLETENITLEVLNSEFVREDKATLEQVLPSVFDLAVPLIADGLGALTLPNIAGFTLSDLRLQKVQTSEDTFLAIYASLGANAALLDSVAQAVPTQAAEPARLAHLTARVAELAAAPAPPKVSGARAAIAAVDVPTPEIVRGFFTGTSEGRLPTITVDVDATDALGRPLEWTWNLDGGMNRPFSQQTPLIISDRALAWQGRYQLELRARVVGDYRTIEDAGTTLPVIIDSVPPKLLTDRIEVEGDAIRFPVTDLVAEADEIELAFGRPEDDRPATEWQHETSIEKTVLQGIAAGTRIAVWTRDSSGNEGREELDLAPIAGFHGGGDGGGCNCDARSDSASGHAVLALLVAFTMFFLRRRPLRGVRVKRSLTVLLAALVSLQSGCGGSSSSDAEPMCAIDADCAAMCPTNTFPLCFQEQCVCAEDVTYGNVGQFSDLAVATDGSAWISAYNATHGDLMVAQVAGAGRISSESWQFIDGVPEGPVVLPQSEVRGGVFAKGPDVGKHTSIAVAPDGTVLIGYLDADAGALRLIGNYGGVWQSHVVDEGGAELAGLYTSLTLRSDDGRPGIAYFAQVTADDGTLRNELRYASAQTATPTSAADWQIWVVDEATVPAADEGDVFPIPAGTGLFIDAARLADQSPVIAYYSRQQGDLMLARFDPVAGVFTTPEVLDGESADVGWYPSIAVGADDVIHVTYVNATSDDLFYINTADRSIELIDDGYRKVLKEGAAEPTPELHFVGEDSSLVLGPAGPVVAYQDATSHELLLARRAPDGTWSRDVIAGDDVPFRGGYGFYAAAALAGDEVVMSSWVIDQPASDAWVEVFRRPLLVE